MSPEQVRGEKLDVRTDLFSFGVVLYEMTTGRRPFSGDTSGLIFDSILNRAPTPPVRLNPEMPAELERIINKALEKDREIRCQSAAELRADLKRLKRDTESGHKRVATSLRGSELRKLVSATKSRWPLVISLALAVFAVSFGYKWIIRRWLSPHLPLTEYDFLAFPTRLSF